MRRSSLVLAPMLLVATAAVLARAVVYESGGGPSDSFLAGRPAPAAFAGGVALAFSRPFLLVLAPYLVALIGVAREESPPRSGRHLDWGPPVAYLLAFALVFIVTISGRPEAIARPLYRSESIIDPVGGAVLVVGGVLTAISAGARPVARASMSLAQRLRRVGYGGLLGATVGALMYHELDPAYDSVFFATANAVAASHAPLTVAAFTAGLGVMYLTAGAIAGRILAHARWSSGALVGGRAVSGAATALIGLALVSDGFGVIRRLLF